MSSWIYAPIVFPILSIWYHLNNSKENHGKDNPMRLFSAKKPTDLPKEYQ